MGAIGAKRPSLADRDSRGRLPHHIGDGGRVEVLWGVAERLHFRVRRAGATRLRHGTPKSSYNRPTLAAVATKAALAQASLVSS